MMVFGRGDPVMSCPFCRLTVPTIGLAVGHSVSGPRGNSAVGGAFTSAGAAKACWMASFAARTTSGTVVPAGTASIIALVIS